MAGFRFVAIGDSVGRQGKNLPHDVTSVQEIINAHLPPGVSELVVDGVSGAKTEFAIETVERRYLHAGHPDGRMDPQGPTLRALNFASKTAFHPHPSLSANSHVGAAHVGANADLTSTRLASAVGSHGLHDTGHQDGHGHWHEPPAGTAPPPEIIAAARLSQARWRTPASITLAQWTKESTWGHRIPPGSRNYFGIKAAKGEPFVKAWTTEIVNHVPVRKLLAFRVYSSDAECFDAHGRILAHHPAYAAARAHLGDPDGYAWGLQGHYATDEAYAKDLIKRMHVYNLYQYNR